MFEPVSRAIKSHTTNIRLALDRAKLVAEKSTSATTKLQSSSKQIENQCNQMQSEIEKFIQSYKRAVEEHRKNLHQQVHRTKEEKMHMLDMHRVELQKKINDAKEVVTFVGELLEEGTDVEILSFVKPILKKLEVCNKLDGIQEMRVAESLQFLPEEIAQNTENCCPIYGVVTTQTVSPKNCHLHTEGNKQ